MKQSAAGGSEERLVRIAAGEVVLEGNLGLPANASGVVLFAHGSGSSRHSPRNRFVARTLREAGLATLLMDLLSADEEREDMRTGSLRFDIALLTRRLVAAVRWLRENPDTSALRIGCFGASTGAAAALATAAALPDAIRAVVSRGGRPDLTGPALADVRAPTLLIVGGHDYPVIEMNRAAMKALRCEVKLEIVPAATHLFEEPGALEEVAELATEWFRRHLAAGV
ncbi:MAG: alpha/beta hydrolase [Verrucomicrobia bacterium]|nr:alpha/beta hydrolase [Verrucomicrobiota bacterium]